MAGYPRIHPLSDACQLKSQPLLEAHRLLLREEEQLAKLGTKWASAIVVTSQLGGWLEQWQLQVFVV